jgi:hypothetical protein
MDETILPPASNGFLKVQQILVDAARLRPATVALIFPRQHTVAAFDLSDHQPTNESKQAYD